MCEDVCVRVWVCNIVGSLLPAESTINLREGMLQCVAVSCSVLQCVVARMPCQSRCENFMSCCRQLTHSHGECV